MLAQIEYPETIQPQELDTYLANGWFRMRQTIFTTNFLQFDQQFYSAIWLRVALADYVPDKKYHTLKKLNRAFKTEIKRSQTGAISSAHELLYLNYRQSVAFDVSPSLHELLLGNDTVNRFDTYEVNIYDGDVLIATGIFDLGANAAAGISCFYHPAYKKYSLGKYLMYLKMEFCRQQQLQYFYPGYVVPGCSPFDYKLEVGKATLEYLQLSTMQWVPYTTKEKLVNPLHQMVERLTILQTKLTGINIPNQFLRYRFFEANLHPYYYGYSLFDFPVFINCFPLDEASTYLVVVFDVRTSCYQLLECSTAINIGFQLEGSTIFDADLLKVKAQIFASPFPEEMVAFMNQSLAQ